MISEGTLRNDGTTAAYVHPGYPSVPDLPIADAARDVTARTDTAVLSGLNASDDAFTARQGRLDIDRFVNLVLTDDG